MAISTAPATGPAAARAAGARAPSRPATRQARAAREAMRRPCSAGLAERGLDDLLLRQLAAAEFGDDAAVAEDVDAVAIVELVGLGRVPEEGAAAARPRRGSGRRPRAWCRYRRRASGRPSGRCARRSRARGRTAPSAGCRRTATGCCCCMSGVRMPIRSLPGLRRARPRAAARSAGRCAAAPASGCRCSRRSTTAGRCRPTGGRRRPAPPARSPRCPVAARGAASKIASSRSVWPWPASPARPMISPSCATSSAPSSCRAGRARTRTGARRVALPAALGAVAARLSAPPMAATSLSRSKAAARVGGDHLAVAHHHDAVGMSAAPRRAGARSGCSSTPPATKRRTKASSWPAVCASSEEVGSSRMTRSQRVVGDGEGARHLDHLAPADRQIADDVGRRRCRGRERSRRACRAMRSPARAPPAEAAQRRRG